MKQLIEGLQTHYEIAKRNVGVPKEMQKHQLTKETFTDVVWRDFPTILAALKAADELAEAARLSDKALRYPRNERENNPADYELRVADALVSISRALQSYTAIREDGK